GIYVAGETCGTLPGQVSLGDCDAFVRKYDASGAEQWTRQFGTSPRDHAQAVLAHSSGIYVAGYTRGILPGQANSGDYDAFVRKYDSGGNVLWTQEFGTSAFDGVLAITADSSGIYVAGETYGNLDGVSSGNADAFVRKYDFVGNPLWTRQFGTSSTDIAWGVSADSSAIYVAGETCETLPGQVSSGGCDAFVRKYDASGTEQWTRQFGSSDFDFAYAVKTDGTGI